MEFVLKIEWKYTENIPYGQFVVTAENEHDRQLICQFTSGQYDKKVEFWLHGTTSQIGLYPMQYSFNFGWVKKKGGRSSYGK